MKRRAIVWFRNDLRLHDNESLTNATRMADEVFPVYVFDERIFLSKTRYGFPKTGKFRAQFILECVAELKSNLRAIGSDLIIRSGRPEAIVAEMAANLKASWVFCNRERTYEEAQVQDTLEKNLWAASIELHYARGKMLYHTADLPVPVAHTPDVFTQFRKETEAVTPVREPLPEPTHLATPLGDMEPGELPSLENLGHQPFEPHPNTAFPFKGGEREGLRRLHNYLWETDNIAVYKHTRNGLLGPDYSSKFSPWLAQGCLSPKRIYHEIRRYERERTANEDTYWLIFELIWRDFFRLMAKKHGNHIFLKNGPRHKSARHLKDHIELFQVWAAGKTGVPFIDANMRELNATGFMSNRGRQNVASFLVKDLKVNWQIGAEYFESQLLDYDPCSNWGNWNYVAGVGSDPREDRYFNILTQARQYDPKGEFVRRWCPELLGVPTEKIHRPDLLTPAERQTHLLQDYPRPVVRIEKWAS
jgi:deoxyribodipyrimidine photo-lyase